MTPSPIRVLCAALLATAAACGGRGAVQTTPPPADGGHAHPAPATPARPVDVTVAGATTAAMHPWTEADVRFMTTMIGHHAQAIQMARLVPERSATPSVRTLADRIINAQEDEIASMQQWLRDRGEPVPPVHDGHHGAHHADMPGMLTQEQLDRLAAASGVEFDRLFLTFMIQHHRGATSMVQALFGSYGAGQDETVFKFASDVNVDQATEIARMQRMLADLVLGAPAP